MEAATASSGSSLLTRDGAVPAAAAIPARGVPPVAGHLSEAIDGVACCASCARFPLLGEQVVRHHGRKGDGWVCESCESAGRGKGFGAAVGRARIRSLGGAMNVRRIA